VRRVRKEREWKVASSLPVWFEEKENMKSLPEDPFEKRKEEK